MTPFPVSSALGASTQPCSSLMGFTQSTGLSNCNVIVNVGTLLTVPASVPRANSAEAFLSGINIDEFLT